jgi:tetratricopeptide (TPR) repeat protein
MKVTNLGIHLINTWLLFLLVLRMAPMLARREMDSAEVRILAAMVALIWAVHPLNVTSVTYIVQRFNSLATLFSLLSILSYLQARTRAAPPLSLVYYSLSFALFLMALFTKENALLIPVFLIVIEVFALRFSSTSAFESQLLKKIAGIVTAIVALGFLYVLVFRPNSLLGGYLFRDFSLGERLLTEARVICWYLWMIVLPNIQQMSLYHDDIVLSTGLLSPASTLLSIAVIVGLLTAGWLLRSSIPALGFAVFWFFGGHLLESTVIPLEIAYEHRNYLPSVGIVIGIAVMLRDGLQRFERRQAILSIVAAIVVCLFSFSTWNRAQNWSDPLLTPIIEAHNKPNSPRAQIEAGIIYNFIAKQAQNEQDRIKFIRSGVEHYSRAKELQPDSPNALFGEIMLYYESGLEPPLELFSDLQNRLKNGFLDATSNGGTQVLVDCWFAKVCRFPGATLVGLLQSVTENPRIFSSYNASTHFNLAKYYAEEAQDGSTAIALLKRAIALNPDAVNYRLSLIEIMLAEGDTHGAREECIKLTTRENSHLYASKIKVLAEKLRQAPK